MIIRTTTTVFFHVPDEHEAHERFKQENDMGEWREHHSTQFWCYSHADEIYTLKGEHDAS